MTFSPCRSDPLVVLIGDSEKAAQLAKCLSLMVHHCSNVHSFVNFLESKLDTSEYLILLTSVSVKNNLPSDVRQKVHDIHIYTEDPNDRNYQTFEDLCLVLRGLFIAHTTARSLAFHLSSDFGLARMYAQHSIELSKIQIHALEDLRDELDEQEQEGQQEIG